MLPNFRTAAGGSSLLLCPGLRYNRFGLFARESKAITVFLRPHVTASYWLWKFLAGWCHFEKLHARERERPGAFSILLPNAPTSCAPPHSLACAAGIEGTALTVVATGAAVDARAVVASEGIGDPVCCCCSMGILTTGRSAGRSAVRAAVFTPEPPCLLLLPAANAYSCLSRCSQGFAGFCLQGQRDPARTQALPKATCHGCYLAICPWFNPLHTKSLNLVNIC